MRYVSTLIVVQDMKKSISFYGSLLGLELLADFGANVVLSGGVSLQTLESWTGFVEKPTSAVVFGNNAGELYFETQSMDDFLQCLALRHDIDLIHPVKEHPWGQRVVRFYDPDKHVIEVGESIDSVVLGFIAKGMTIEETAARMDVPTDYVRSCLSQAE